MPKSCLSWTRGRTSKILKAHRRLHTCRFPQKPFPGSHPHPRPDPTRLPPPGGAYSAPPVTRFGEKLRFRLPTLLGGCRAGCKALRCTPPTSSRHGMELLLSCHAIPYTARLTNGGAPSTTTSRSLCNRSQSSRERIVTRFTILGSCDQPPARCESKSRRKHGRPTELLPFDPQSRTVWTCERRKALGDGLSHDRSASRIQFQFHSPRKGHQRVVRTPLSALLRGASAGETWDSGFRSSCKASDDPFG